MFWYILTAILGLTVGSLFGFFVGWKIANRLNDIFPTWNMGRG